MSSNDYFEQGAQDRLDYTKDFGKWLESAGDTDDEISTCDVVVSPVGLTVDGTPSVGASPAGTPTAGRALSAVLMWLTGGTAGVTYELDVEIVTTQSREKHDKFYVTVHE